MGQFAHSHPGIDLIILRLGHKAGNTDWWGIFTALAEGY
jgi:hypothetical protein